MKAVMLELRRGKLEIQHKDSQFDKREQEKLKLHATCQQCHQRQMYAEITDQLSEASRKEEQYR